MLWKKSTPRTWNNLCFRGRLTFDWGLLNKNWHLFFWDFMVHSRKKASKVKSLTIFKNLNESETYGNLCENTDLCMLLLTAKLNNLRITQLKMENHLNHTSMFRCSIWKFCLFWVINSRIISIFGFKIIVFGLVILSILFDWRNSNQLKGFTILVYLFQIIGFMLEEAGGKKHVFWIKKQRLQHLFNLQSSSEHFESSESIRFWASSP